MFFISQGSSSTEFFHLSIDMVFVELLPASTMNSIDVTKTDRINITDVVFRMAVIFLASGFRDEYQQIINEYKNNNKNSQIVCAGRVSKLRLISIDFPMKPPIIESPERRFLNEKKIKTNIEIQKADLSLSLSILDRRSQVNNIKKKIIMDTLITSVTFTWVKLWIYSERIGYTPNNTKWNGYFSHCLYSLCFLIIPAIFIHTICE